MSWQHFVRKSRAVRLGGWSLGPLRFGGRVYVFRPITLLRLVQWLSSKPAAFDAAAIQRAPLDALRVLIPLSLDRPVRECDLMRASERQVACAAAAAAEVTDLPYVIEKLRPPKDQPKNHGMSLDAAVCAMAQRYHIEPRAVWLWPAVEFVAVLDAEEELVRKSKSQSDDEPRICDAEECTNLNEKLAAFGVELDQ